MLQQLGRGSGLSDQSDLTFADDAVKEGGLSSIKIMM